MALSDIVVVMNAGRIEQSGPPDEVYRRPASRFVADFIGTSNIFAGTAASAGLDVPRLGLLPGTTVDGPVTGAAHLVVRPGLLHALPGPQGGAVHSQATGRLLLPVRLHLANQILLI